MKMKKMLATVMATALAVTMIPAAAFATGTEKVDWDNNNGTDTREGEGTVKQPHIEVTLPGDLAFEVDPLKLNSNAEILGNDYNIINHSEVPVKVIVKPYINLDGNDTLEVVSANDLRLMTDATKGYEPVSSNNVDTKKKSVAIMAIAASQTSADIPSIADVYRFGYDGDGAKTLGRTAFGSTAIAEDGSIIYKITTNSTTTPTFSLSHVAATPDTNGVISLEGKKESTQKLEFLLGPDSYDADGNSESLTQDGKIKSGKAAIATSFTFTGAVDPRKTYENGEINVVANFEMKIVTDNDLANIDFEGHNVTTASGVTRTATGTGRQQLITDDRNTYK